MNERAITRAITRAMTNETFSYPGALRQDSVASARDAFGVATLDRGSLLPTDNWRHSDRTSFVRHVQVRMTACLLVRHSHVELFSS